MKKLIIYMLFCMPILAIGQEQANNKHLEPSGFTDKDQVFVGDYSSFAIKNGELWAWGQNEYGELGNGTLVDQYTPIRIGNANQWTFIASKYGRTIGLQSDGSLWAWGRNYDNSYDKNQTIPTAIGGDSKWRQISLGQRHAHGIKADGTLWAWGNNEGMEFGNGTTTSSDVPVQIGTESNWLTVYTSEYTMALKTDGTLWSWGRDLKKSENGNEGGQLGLGHKRTVTTPTLIVSETKWKNFGIGGCYNQAVDVDGKRWAWGFSYSFGQLGFGELKMTELKPKKDESNTWIKIECFTSFSIGIKSDQSIWYWGKHPTTSKITATPELFELGFDYKKLAYSFHHLLVIKADGTLVTFGENTYGQLGTGTNTGISGFTSPPSSKDLELKSNIENLKKLMLASFELDKPKFDSIIATKDKWDIGGTYDLITNDCMNSLPLFELKIHDRSSPLAYIYAIEVGNSNVSYVNFTIDDKRYDYTSKEEFEEQKKMVFGKQTEQYGGGNAFNYGSNIDEFGIQITLNGKVFLLQDLRILRGVAKGTLHYEQFNTVKQIWEFIDCTFEGKLRISR